MASTENSEKIFHWLFTAWRRESSFQPYSCEFRLKFAQFCVKIESVRRALDRVEVPNVL